MNQGQITIIIPTPQFNPRLPVLESLAECRLDSTHYEILVAEGENPSRQRNSAIGKAHGEFLLFLDGDCQVNANYFAQLKKQIESLEFDVLGGPVVLPPGAPLRQQIFQAALADPLVARAAAARYAPRGSLRRCDESELILCNLAVRTDFFRKSGGFNEALYPNEENEWLDRVALLAHVYYDPDLRAWRRQRETWQAFARMLIRYGVGRTQQLLASRRFNPKQLPALLLLLWIVLLVVAPTAAIVIGLVSIIAFVTSIAVTKPPDRDQSRMMVAVAGSCIVFFYAVGQIIGFFPKLPRLRPPKEIRILNERGDLMR